MAYLGPMNLLIYKKRLVRNNKDFTINGRTIVLQSDGPFSGMTLFDENAFVLGKEAFASGDELTKTILQELYRLGTSEVGASRKAGQGIVSSETKNAFQFAEEVYKGLK